MQLKGKSIGFVLTDVFYTFNKIIPKIREIVTKEAQVIPIISFKEQNKNISKIEVKEYIEKIEEITNMKVIDNIQKIYELEKVRKIDIVIIAPCSGNTISKLACNIVDTSATVMVNEGLKNSVPIVIAPIANNGLSENAENIGKLLNRKNYYFVPFRQYNPITKPRAISFDSEYIVKTIEYALEKEQISPILL